MYGYGLGNYGMMNPYGMYGMYGQMGGSIPPYSVGNNYATPVYQQQYAPIQEVEAYEPAHKPSVAGEILKLGAVAAVAVGVTLLAKGKGGKETKNLIKEAAEEVTTVIKKTKKTKKTNVKTDIIAEPEVKKGFFARLAEKRAAKKEAKLAAKEAKLAQETLAKNETLNGIMGGLLQNAKKAEAPLPVVKKESVRKEINAFNKASKERQIAADLKKQAEINEAWNSLPAADKNLNKIYDDIKKTAAASKQADMNKGFELINKPAEVKTKKKLFGGLFERFSKENRIARIEEKAARKITNNIVKPKSVAVEPPVIKTVETTTPKSTQSTTKEVKAFNKASKERQIAADLKKQAEINEAWNSLPAADKNANKIYDDIEKTAAAAKQADMNKGFELINKPVEVKTKKKLFGGLFERFSKENRIARIEEKAARKVTNNIVEPKSVVVEKPVVSEAQQVAKKEAATAALTEIVPKIQRERFTNTVPKYKKAEIQTTPEKKQGAISRFFENINEKFRLHAEKTANKHTQKKADKVSEKIVSRLKQKESTINNSSKTIKAFDEVMGTRNALAEAEKYAQMAQDWNSIPKIPSHYNLDKTFKRFEQLQSINKY